VNTAITTLLVVIGLLVTQSIHAGPEEDRQHMVDYYQQHYPDMDIQEFADGLYAFEQSAREQWLELEDFPPYEPAIDEGREFFSAPFANGKSYADCFENDGIGVRQNYPFFDNDVGAVITIELAINQCREKNGAEPLNYRAHELVAISAYMAYTSRGNMIEVSVPANNPQALMAYEAGKQFFYSRRGQLDFACSGCHVQSFGLTIRADPLSPAVGQATHWPAYRTVWGDLVTLHRRFQECNFLVRSRPLEEQSIEYRNLEYFLSYMSNGLRLNGPSSRR